MVFQSYALFPHLDVAGNIAFGLKRRKGWPTARSAKRVGEGPRAGQPARLRAPPANELSGGQQQRVALARALVNGPNVLLLDEPLGALDLKLRKRLQVELKRIQAEVGITFVYVTHDQEEALTMSDRIAVMNGGRIEQLGTPEDLYDRPATRSWPTSSGRRTCSAARSSGGGGGVATVRLERGDRCVGSTTMGWPPASPSSSASGPRRSRRPARRRGPRSPASRTGGIPRSHRPVPHSHGRRLGR